jgi:hypothetical protein
MDFMTMSDNASNWSSCMSWSSADGGGCYKIGTVEVMNSNCVVCCYLESSNESFYFNSKDADHKWNNKKWRQLFYITKDIIVSGKPYPYNSEILTKEVLCLLQKLSKENLGVKYSFGPEVYMDMKTVYSEDDFEKARDDKKGKRILFDTKGMYNDMANDHDMIFTCVRNKIKKNKIINISGKNPCLCCNGDVIENLYEDEYNDRYENTGSLVCQSCIEDNFNCDECGRVSPFKKIYNVGEKRLCVNCATKFKKCPCGCGTILNTEKDFLIDDESIVCTYRVSDEYPAVNQRRGILQSYYHTSEQAIKNHGFCALYMCKDEAKRRIKAGELAKTSKVLELSKDDTPFYRYFSRDDDFFITKKSYDELNDDMKKFLIENLENAYKIEE